MKIQLSTLRRGFTLIETVIAIGVLTVLLTGFMYVFAPAAAGIKKAIGVQEADRLTSTLEQEFVVLRGKAESDKYKTGFGKAFEWIKTSNKSTDALFIYQYRGSLSQKRPDDTPEPVVDLKGKQPGVDYSLQTMVRRNGDDLFLKDLKAVEGGVYYVKCTQLVFDSSQLKPGTIGEIADPKNSTTKAATSDAYPEAVIAFTADFYTLKNRNPESFTTSFPAAFDKTATKPIFSRNLAVRR